MTSRLALFVLILFFAGCAVQTQRPIHPCAGKSTAAEAIDTLNQRRQQAIPIRATGQCLLRYHIEGKQHPASPHSGGRGLAEGGKDNFPVKLWVNPPNEVYLQGDVAFDAAGLVLGSNADEFWFWLKPKEVSAYWWGEWSQGGVWNRLALSPVMVLEAFGGVNVRDGDWSLTQDGDFDVLVLHSGQDAIAKRVYIERCNYVVAKIEQFDSAGRVAVRAEFADYKQIAEGFFAPASIRIVAVAGDGIEDSVGISLVSVQSTKLSEEQKQRLFVRPQSRGFDHVYKIIDGTAVEQIRQQSVDK